MGRRLGTFQGFLVAYITFSLGTGCAQDITCPPEMLLVEGFGQLACIDRYEASRGNDDEAVSVAGAYPWVGVTWGEALDACERAGKRLCTDAEWAKACEGPGSGSEDWPKFPYGNAFELGRCNDVGDGSLVRRTRSHFRCEGGYDGLFDMSGNVAEWADRCRDGLCFAQGGSFIDFDTLALSCNVNQSHDPEMPDELVGFRCCLTP